MADSVSLSTVIVQLKVSFDPSELGGHAFTDPILYELSSRRGIKFIEVMYTWAPPTTDADRVEFSAAELAKAFWPESLHQPVTIGATDYPIQSVRVVPFALGLKIQKCDPGNTYFHVELFPKPRDREPFAEVWSRQAWADVVACRLRRERAAAAEKASSMLDRETDLKARLRWHLSHTTRLSADDSAKAAHNFIRGGAEWDTILQMVKLPKEIYDELLAVRASLASANAGPSTTNDPCPTTNPL